MNESPSEMGQVIKIGEGCSSSTWAGQCKVLWSIGVDARLPQELKLRGDSTTQSRQRPSITSTWRSVLA